MIETKENVSDPTHCPLCGEPNQCQLSTVEAYKGPCWCASVKFPPELLARVPADQVNKACICRQCVETALRESHRQTPLAVKPGDFYFEAGLLVFTEAYHLRRGYCCGSGCRHCPYQTEKP